MLLCFRQVVSVKCINLRVRLYFQRVFDSDPSSQGSGDEDEKDSRPAADIPFTKININSPARGADYTFREYSKIRRPAIHFDILFSLACSK
jgi:hypothetical protein